MLNLPDSLYPDPIQADNTVMSNGGAPMVPVMKQGRNQDLALHIWQSISTVFLLLSEVLSIYKSLTPEKLTMKDSIQIHCYLYPFLETEETSKPFQYLRLMSLGVIGGLLKEVGDPSTEVAVHCLLESGLFPLCLKSIEYGNELSQSTASWIMSRIMMQEQGLQYYCEPANRLCAIMKVFNDVIEKMQDEPSTIVLKNIIQCYVILSNDPSRGCLLLRSFIPPILTTAPYIEALRARPVTLKNLQDLFQKLSMGCGPNAEAVGVVAGKLSELPNKYKKDALHTLLFGTNLFLWPSYCNGSYDINNAVLKACAKPPKTAQMDNKGLQSKKGGQLGHASEGGHLTKS
ncbi:cell differentiation protein rcd1-like [Apium graveolens]|uniref:cell differentiation protein rcd1-like n=1 Tax=Apium graveolens TaxID=4045 RepID=UPI003D7B44A1